MKKKSKLNFCDSAHIHYKGSKVDKKLVWNKVLVYF